MKVARRGSRALAGVVLGLLAAVGGATAFESASVGATTAPGPWQVSDPEATLGGIDFFDASGVIVTTGSTSAPFAAFAVAQDAPAGGLKATLFAYTPVSGQAAGNWTGSQLTTAKAYPITSPADLAGLANPIVTGTAKDITLAAYIATTPNTDTSATDGYAGIYEVRMQVSGTDGYATAYISITGSTWTQVPGTSYPSPASGGSGATTTSTAVSASPVSPTTTGIPVTFTATVTPNTAVGAVQFMDSGTALGSAITESGGVATSVATSALPAGTHSITAVFTPTSAASFTVSTSPPISYVVNASGGSGATTTSTAVTASPVSPTTTGTPVTFTATMTPNTAVGAVQFMDNGTAFGSAITVSGGVATSVATSTLPAGTHSITAVFTPTSSASFTTSTSSAISYVVNASGGSGATTTSTVVTASPASPQNTGTSVTFTATVTPNTAVGAVQFVDGTTNLGSAATVSGGVATSVATSTLPAGTHSITAVFTPTSAAAFVASTSAAISYQVNASGAAATTTTATASPASPTTAGTSVTFTATVTPSTTAGSVQFKDGTNNLGSVVTVASGTATLTTTTLPQGAHSISAVFTPTTLTAFNLSTSSAINYQVNASSTAVATTTALAVSPTTTAATGAVVQLTATVTCTATCTPAGTVNFWDGGSVQIGATQTVVGGSATVSTTTLAIGSSHSFVAIFTPTDLTAFAASQSAAVPYSITSTDSGSATVIDSAGTALGADPTLAPGQVVTVQAGGFTAGEKVSATVHSVPETLIPATATSAGAVAYPFTVPTDLAAGAHSLVLVGATSSHTVTINFSIAAPSVLGEPPATASSGSLPFTGTDVRFLCTIAALCICAGMVIRFGGREPQFSGGAHARRGPGAHARVGAKHSRH